jgi:hypothetical protein
VLAKKAGVFSMSNIEFIGVSMTHDSSEYHLSTLRLYVQHKADMWRRREERETASTLE